MISPLDIPVGQYNGVAQIIRIGPGAKARGNLCTATLKNNEPQTVAGNLKWDHANMTGVAGDFEVKQCGKPEQ